jgi:hypothetical protein
VDHEQGFAGVHETIAEPIAEGSAAVCTVYGR